jgi:Ser/Thr protein kinase RdoA (MazF antagonist)
VEDPPTHLWGVTTPVAPLLGGHRNKAFRTLGLDQDFVFKTTRRNPASIAWLLPVMDLAAQSGFIVPHPIASKAGRIIEHGWSCEPFIRGEPFRPEDMPSVAPPLARFHEASTGIKQRPDFRAAANLIHHDHGGDIDLRAMPADIAALCRESWAQLAHQPTCVVHGDLNPANLIHTDDNRIALLDWDECRVDAALFDDIQTGVTIPDQSTRLAVLAWEIACSWQLEPDYAANLATKLMQMPHPHT